MLQFKVNEYKTIAATIVEPEVKAAYSTIQAYTERKLVERQAEIVVNISTAMAVNNLSPK